MICPWATYDALEKTSSATYQAAEQAWHRFLYFLAAAGLKASANA
jgi:hypothetical protein